jgi:hypothetical protein
LKFLFSSLSNLQEYELKQQRKYLDILATYKKKTQDDEAPKSGRAWRDHARGLTK